MGGFLLQLVPNTEYWASSDKCGHAWVCAHMHMYAQTTHTDTLILATWQALPVVSGQEMQAREWLCFTVSAALPQHRGGVGGAAKKWLLISFAWVLLIRTGSWEGDALLCRGHSHNESWHLMDYPDLFHKGCLIFSHRLLHPWVQTTSAPQRLAPTVPSLFHHALITCVWSMFLPLINCSL